MSTERSLAFYKLLHEVEYEIGSECYNGNIQNFWPGGVWEGEGREYRYPVRFTNSKGKNEKYSGEFPFTKTVSGEIAQAILGEERYQSAHYAFGANQLYILRGIRHALEKIERRFNLDFDQLLKNEQEQQESSVNK